MPQHNGVAERMNQTLLDKVRAMLIDADLPETYWYDALCYAVYIHNVTPTHALENKTPEEAWSGNKPDISDLHVFRARAFIHIPESQRKKLESRSLICTFIGFAHQWKAYYLIHRETCRLLKSHDVIFDKGGPKYERLTIEHNDAEPSTTQPQVQPQVQPLDHIPQTHVPQLQLPQLQGPATLTPTPILSWPKCTSRIPIHGNNPWYSVSSYGPQAWTERASLAHIETMPDLKTYAKVMKCPDTDLWDAACKVKKKSFEIMDIYDMVPRPKNRKILGSKWVLRIKRGPDGAVQKYKAHVVAQGFTQIEGVDYDKTFAPVAKLASLHTILAMAMELNWEIHQMDVKVAYLNTDLDEEIYMQPPPGFDVPKGMVLKLNKAVYGTKQGSCTWYKNVRAELEDMGYTCTKANHAIFIHFRDGVIFHHLALR